MSGVRTVKTSFGLGLYAPDGLSDTHDPHHNGKVRHKKMSGGKREGHIFVTMEN